MYVLKWNTSNNFYSSKTIERLSATVCHRLFSTSALTCAGSVSVTGLLCSTAGYGTIKALCRILLLISDVPAALSTSVETPAMNLRVGEAGDSL